MGTERSEIEHLKAEISELREQLASQQDFMQGYLDRVEHLISSTVKIIEDATGERMPRKRHLRSLPPAGMAMASVSAIRAHPAIASLTAATAGVAVILGVIAANPGTSPGPLPPAAAPTAPRTQPSEPHRDHHRARVVQHVSVAPGATQPVQVAVLAHPASRAHRARSSPHPHPTPKGRPTAPAPGGPTPSPSPHPRPICIDLEVFSVCLQDQQGQLSKSLVKSPPLGNTLRPGRVKLYNFYQGS